MSYPNLIDNSPMGLVDALVARISKVITPSWWQEAEFDDEEFHTPVIHAQYLPTSRTEVLGRDSSKDYPLVQVFCSGGTLESFVPASLPSKINVKIICGGYSKNPDNQGWRIPTAMTWRILQDFFARRQLAGYQMKLPVSWSMLPDREPPYWATVVETIWQGSVPAQLLLGGRREAGREEILKVNFGEA